MNKVNRVINIEYKREYFNDFIHIINKEYIKKQRYISIIYNLLVMIIYYIFFTDNISFLSILNTFLFTSLFAYFIMSVFINNISDKAKMKAMNHFHKYYKDKALALYVYSDFIQYHLNNKPWIKVKWDNIKEVNIESYGIIIKANKSFLIPEKSVSKEDYNYLLNKLSEKVNSKINNNS